MSKKLPSLLMSKPILWLCAGILVFACLFSSQTVSAQGVTTAAVNGLVTDNNGQPVYGANVIALHVPSGSRFGAATRADGRYNIPAMRVGGPYTIFVTYIGYKEDRREDITLALGENRRVDFKVVEETIEGEAIVVVSERNPIISESRTGAAKTVSNLEIQTMPTLSRDFGDFTRLTPQFAGNSAAGRNNRFNNIQIDGAVNNDLFGLAASGTPGGQASTSPISLDAIQEFQVVIAPYDVRQGGFTGAGINAITRSGTNNIEASGYYFYKSQDLVRNKLNDVKITDFSEKTAGFRVGGPIMKDKLFFFANAEITRRTDPTDYGITGDSNATDFIAIPVDTAQALLDFLDTKYGYNPGGFGMRNVPIKSNKAFIRFDYNISDNHRLTVRHNYVGAEQEILRRVTGQSATSSSTGFRFGDAGYIFKNTTNSTVMQLNSTLAKSFYNELTVGYSYIDDKRGNPADRFPTTIIRNGGSQMIVGTEQFSQFNFLKQSVLEVTDNVTYFMGDHTFTAGTHNEFFSFENSFLPQYNGRYEFNSLTNFIRSANGDTNQIRSYFLTYPVDPATGLRDNSRTPLAKFSVSQLGFYVQDAWSVLPNMKVTLGLRIDVPIISDKPTYNATFDSAYGKSTSEVATGNLLFSPRMGFNWDVFDNNATQVRGGLGIFSGRSPYVWISNQYSNTGADFGTVQFTTSGNEVRPLIFNEDPTNQPIVNRVGAAVKGYSSTINIMDKNFKYPQVARLNLAVDHELPGGLIGTLELIASDPIYDAMFQDISLAGPQSYSPNDGRPRFGVITPGTITAGSGSPTISPTRKDTLNLNRPYSNVMYLTNSKNGYQYNFTVQLQKTFESGFAGKYDKGLYAQVAYTLGRSTDVTSATSSIAFSNWQFNPTKGDPNNKDITATSNYEQRHAIIASISQSLEFVKNWKTTVSFFYSGRSGQPYSTTYNGDVNADGAFSNDLIYVPIDKNDIVLVGSNASDTRTPDQIWVDLDDFISDDPALDKARGKIIGRNASRSPWVNRVDFKLAQEIPVTDRYGKFELTMDIFNLMNLLNKDWGESLFVNNQNLSPIAFRGVRSSDNKPVFSFLKDPNLVKGRYLRSNVGSRWQMQLGVRYTF
ncbi:TonB-dependent receptor [bacterium]|nr:TonB-dependent receptor [bacterium]